MKNPALFLMAMIFLAPGAWGQESAQLTSLKNTTTDLVQEDKVFDSRLKKIRAEIKNLEKSVQSPRKSIKDALTQIEKALDRLEGAFGRKGQQKQILVETCFVELALPLELDIDTKHGVPVATDEATVQQLKDTGDGISAPSIIILDGQEATVETRQSHVYHYLERRQNRQYIMRKTTVDDGVILKLNAKIVEAPSGAFLNIVADFKTTSIVGTTPCRKDAETVGLPVVSTREVQSHMTVTQNVWYIVPVTTLKTSKKSVIFFAIKAEILQ